MALVEATLRRDMLALFRDMRAAPMTEEEYAGRMAGIITGYIRTATVTVNPGIAVATPAGAGSTTSPGTGRLS